MTDEKTQSRLRKVVLKVGLRGSELARRSGIRRARISEWKNGKVNLTYEELGRITSVIEARLLEQSEPGQMRAIALTDMAGRGAEIRRKRLQFGITQADLAKRARMSQTDVSLLETGASASSQVPAEISELEKAIEILVNEKKQSITPGERKELVPLRGLLQANTPAERAENVQEYRKAHESVIRDFGSVENLRTFFELGKQLEAQERQLTALEAQLAALREQNNGLREWINQEQKAALEHSKAKELEEKVLMADGVETAGDKNGGRT